MIHGEPKHIEPEVWHRARKLFEKENRRDRIWGRVSQDGKKSVGVKEMPPGEPSAPPLSESERAPYIRQAEKEIAAEERARDKKE
jgi:hypothetical protein